MFILPEEIISYVILPYVIDDIAFQHYLCLFSEKRIQYLSKTVQTFIERSNTQENDFVDILTSTDSSELKMVHAAHKGHLFMVQYFVEVKEADIHFEDDLAFHCASEYDHFPILHYLIEMRANVNAHNNSALEWHCLKGRLSIVECLIKAKADVNANNGQILCFSAFYGHLPVVKCLIKAKADIHAQDDAALRLAESEGHLDIVSYLKFNTLLKLDRV